MKAATTITEAEDVHNSEGYVHVSEMDEIDHDDTSG